MDLLHEFVSSNRAELVRRCRSRVSERNSPPLNTAALAHGVPLVLEQPRTPAAAEVSRTAALHGSELRVQGYTAGQVVQDYADIGDAITELAAEQRASVSIDDAHTLNRFLDSAIADAVASYGGLTKSREFFARY